MRFFKKTLSLILAVTILAGMAFNVTVSAEKTSEIVYETTSYDDGTSVGGDGTALVFFKGDLPGTNGEKYIITYEGKAYTNQPGMNFRLYYGDTFVNAYQKDEWKESYNNGVAINRGNENPYNFKSVVEVDFGKEIPEAAIKVYDHDLTTVLVDTVMQLEGWTGLIKIGVKNWSINGSEHYERPIDPKLTVEQVVPAGEEPDEPEETTVVYETTSYDDGTSAGGDGTALVFFKGDLPGTNGEKYIITYEGQAHTNQPGMNFRLYYGDTYVDAYQKDEWKESYNNGVAINRGNENPYNFKSVVEVDFGKEIPEAAIKVYDHDLTTVLVDTVKQLEGWTGLIKIGVKNWSINGSEHYERPISPKLTVEKVVPAGEEPDEPEEPDIPDEPEEPDIPDEPEEPDIPDEPEGPKESKVTWVSIYDGDGSRRAAEEGARDVYHDLYDGELSPGLLYKLKWKVRFYKGGGVNSGSLIVEDEDSRITFFTKGQDNNFFDGMEFGKLDDSGNPDDVVIEMEIDFDSDVATVKFYDDKNSTKLFGQKTVNISELDSIKKVYYYVPNKGDGTFSQPQQSSMEIFKGWVYPEVRNVKITGADETKVLYGTDALDLSKMLLTPEMDKIYIDMNTEVDLESAESAITLKAKGSEENLLSDLSQEEHVITANVSGEILGETEYTLTVKNTVLTADGEREMAKAFSLVFKTDKKRMEGQIDNSRIEGGVLKADLTFNNKSEVPKTWCFIVNCYDDNGLLVWCGICNGEEAIEGTLETTAEITLPDGTLPDGTSIVKAYLWDSLMLTDMYSEGIEILN